jgi:hypothetical protein
VLNVQPETGIEQLPLQKRVEDHGAADHTAGAIRVRDGEQGGPSG